MSTQVSSSSPDSLLAATAPARAPRIRLEYLDGLRGIAALYVLLFHIYTRTNFDGSPAWFASLQSLPSYGHHAVCVFIVLSGFCLMLPIARSPHNELRGGVGGFVKRRALRILPPYYAALLLSLGWVLLHEGIKHHAGLKSNLFLEFSMGNLLSHLFLVFNLIPIYWEATNAALWSVASEWQIYFVFVLLLFPFWKRFGNIPTLLFAFLLGIGPHYLLSHGTLYDSLNKACTWFIGLFAIGMIGAVVAFPKSGSSPTWLQRAPWGTLCVGFLSSLVLLTLLVRPSDNPWDETLIRHYTWTSDSLCGLATICFVLFCHRQQQPQKDDNPLKALFNATLFFRNLLETRGATTLGGFSYSLYLTHTPVLSVLLYVVFHLHLPPIVGALIMWIGGIALSLLVAMGFSRVFERPFLSRRVAPASVSVPATESPSLQAEGQQLA